MTPEQMTFPDTRAMTPLASRDLMADALAWIDANKGAWRTLVRIAKTEALTIRRVRVKSYIEELRGMRGVDNPDTASPVKLPNAFSAPFGRILAAWYPDLTEYIPLHRSKADGCVIPPCPKWARL